MLSSLLSGLLLHLLCSLPAPAIAGVDRCTATTTSKTYRNCMTLPTQGASLAWTYHPHNLTLDLAFSGVFISPSGWVAWGINPDSPSMTGTHALIAFSDPTSGGLLLLPFVLDPSIKLQRSRLVSRPFGLSLLSSSASLTGSAVRDGANVQIFATLRLGPNRTRLHHVWNRGLYVQGYSPTIHPTAPSDLASRSTIDVATSASSELVPTIAVTLRPTHAAINTLSWGLLLPVGVMVARYLRQWPSVGPTWFYSHAVIQITGILLGTAGFAMGIMMGKASEGVEYGLHRGLGVAAFVTGGLQAAALLFRPKTTHRYRKYWKSYHHFVGYGCVVLGVVNVFQGLEVMGLGRSYWKLAYCLALSTVIGVCVALEANAWVMFCRTAEEDKARREGVQVSNAVMVKGGV